MLEKRGADWGDKVRLIGLSIDNDVPTVKNHVESKNWKKVEHYHVRNGACTADNDYGVKGVPHVLLVDTHGTIVFMGHPASRKIEEDIDNLLKGEKLTGEGTGAASSKAEEGGEGSTSLTQERIAQFQTETKAFLDEGKKIVEGCPRAFLVLVVEEKWDMKTQKSKQSA